MKQETKYRMWRAFNDVSEIMHSLSKASIKPEYVGEESKKGLKEYKKSCRMVSKILKRMSLKYVD